MSKDSLPASHYNNETDDNDDEEDKTTIMMMKIPHFNIITFTKIEKRT